MVKLRLGRRVSEMDSGKAYKNATTMQSMGYPPLQLPYNQCIHNTWELVFRANAHSGILGRPVI